MRWTKIDGFGYICPKIPGTELQNRKKTARVDELSYDQSSIVDGRRAKYKIVLAQDHQLVSTVRGSEFWYNTKGTSNTQADNLMTLDQEVGLRKLLCSGQFPLDR
ncbi:MAG: hypothetical protein QNJ37_13390 [Crocosphaera sp.]|nr:hypothetical protein [Crocosphaera sp.]